jgi:pantetheine-phosphate adenylyltransferase
MRTVLYPGSFDPVTYAHLDIAARASRLFDRVVMGVFDRPKKNLLFSTAERLALLQEAVQNLLGVEAVSYSILTVDFARQIGACAMVRGLRTASDFEAEFVMAQVNQTIDPSIDAVILMSSQRFSHVSSSTVREMAAMGRDPVEFVPPHIIPALQQKFAQRG